MQMIDINFNSTSFNLDRTIASFYLDWIECSSNQFRLPEIKSNHLKNTIIGFQSSLKISITVQWLETISL